MRLDERDSHLVVGMEAEDTVVAAAADMEVEDTVAGMEVEDTAGAAAALMVMHMENREGGEQPHPG